MTNLTDKTLLEVYKATLGEEQFFTTLFENRLSFYSGLLSTIMTAVVLGIFYSQTSTEYIALLFGPIVLIFISMSGINAAKRGTTRVYKVLAVRAKLEQALGLTKPQKYRLSDKDIYWNSEPIADVDHISIRKSYKNSSDFSSGGVNNKGNLLHQTIRFYNFFILLGVIGEGFIGFKLFQLIQ
ncbi:MAG: hypothetical protein U0Z26_18320 [Anaerolineales bacterium]